MSSGPSHEREQAAHSNARRSFLALTAVVAASAISLGYLAWPQRRAVYDRFFTPRIPTKSGALSSEELRDIQSLAQLIFPPSSAAQRIEIDGIVARWAQVRCGEDGLLHLYQTGLRFIRDIATREGHDQPLRALSATDRAHVLRAVVRHIGMGEDERAYWVSWRDALDRFRHRKSRYFLIALRRELIRGIFTSRLGWELVGYESWPGVGGDPREYTRAPLGPTARG